MVSDMKRKELQIHPNCNMYEHFIPFHGQILIHCMKLSSLSSSNIYPENATANGHDFQMFSFEETTSCKACQMLLRWESGRMGLGPGLGQHFLF